MGGLSMNRCILYTADNVSSLDLTITDASTNTADNVSKPDIDLEIKPSTPSLNSLYMFPGTNSSTQQPLHVSLNSTSTPQPLLFFLEL